MSAPWDPVNLQMRRYWPPEQHPYAVLEATIARHLQPSASVLEIGCGRKAAELRRLVGRAARLRGIDVADFVAAPDGVLLLRESVSDMPSIEDGSVDLAFSRSVMEHVEHMENAYSELARVLREGGVYIFLTPNALDYASIIARALPNALHPWIVHRVEGRAAEDVFPTYYRSNTARAIRGLADGSGLAVERIEYLGQYPAYLTFNRLAFWIGARYERLISRFGALSVLRGWLLVVLRKPTAS